MDTESSKVNGLLESRTYDTYASSSGYSSEDDYAGRNAVVGCWGHLHGTAESQPLYRAQGCGFHPVSCCLASHRLIESLRLENSSKIIRSNRQPIPTMPPDHVLSATSTRL